MAYEKLRQEIRSDPYKFICNWMETRLPFTGRKAMEVVALLPPSLILPDFNYHGDQIRSNINVLLMTPPSGGKSTLAKEFALITFLPFEASSITPRKLEAEVKARGTLSFVVGDFSRMIKDQDTIKVIENVIGEEKRLQRHTMRGSFDSEVNAVGLFCGTNQDLSTYLTGGYVFRVVPVIISHNADQHSEIGQKIVESMNRDSDFAERREVIRDFYYELLEIQRGEHEKFKQITSCYLNPTFIKEAYAVWDENTKFINKSLNVHLNWFRELHEFSRFLFSHAFLNIYNREVREGVLYPNKEDFTIALKLMEDTLQIKYDVVSMNVFSKNISDMRELENVMKGNRLSEQRKNILMNLMQKKKGKLAKR